MPQGPGTYPPKHPLNNPKHPAYADGVVSPQERNQANRNFAQNTGGQVYGQGQPTQPAPAAPLPRPDQVAAPQGNWGGGSFQNSSANIYAGDDQATGKPYFIAGYDQNNQPVFSWSPTFNPQETGYLNRGVGHFADAAFGGKMDPSGFYLSNAQGSQYGLNPVTNALIQTGSYVGGQAPTVTTPQGEGGGVVNEDLMGDGTVKTGNQAVTMSGVGNRTGQAGTVPDLTPGSVNTGQNNPYASFGASGPMQTQQGADPGNRNLFAQSQLTNQSGPFQGGLNNNAAYFNTGGQKPGQVDWQRRLAGGGGAMNDRPGFSASRLF